MKKNNVRLVGVTLALAFFSLFLAGCGSSGESDADRTARLKKENPQMQQMRKAKAGDE